jgi:hypothetical protein
VVVASRVKFVSELLLLRIVHVRISEWVVKFVECNGCFNCIKTKLLTEGSSGLRAKTICRHGHGPDLAKLKLKAFTFFLFSSLHQQDHQFKSSSLPDPLESRGCGDSEVCVEIESPLRKTVITRVVCSADGFHDALTT